MAAGNRTSTFLFCSRFRLPWRHLADSGRIMTQVVAYPGPLTPDPTPTAPTGNAKHLTGSSVPSSPWRPDGADDVPWRQPTGNYTGVQQCRTAAAAGLQPGELPCLRPSDTCVIRGANAPCTPRSTCLQPATLLPQYGSCCHVISLSMPSVGVPDYRYLHSIIQHHLAKVCGVPRPPSGPCTRHPGALQYM